ncbi:MAG: L-2-hydroxyglutarate oxidase [Planctomycetota bacterium]
MSNADFVVVGGGVVGLALALELRRRWPDQSVVVLEKEAECGLHQSGRNSGVLHAGFYYTADSLKARFCRDGNAYWRDYCEARRLPIHRCGKLVVAQNESQLESLDLLHSRGRQNGVELEMISAAAAREIEPRVKTCERALWSPNTASVDPKQVMARLALDAQDAGVTIRRGARYVGRQGQRVQTATGDVEAGHVVNAAGVYADRVARDYGFCQGRTMLPFKGLYLYGSAPPGTLRTNIYPVPDLNYPFLGVHFTVTVDGKAKIGPTATPAFWCEHYQGLQNFRLGELARVVSLEASLMVRAGFPFRRLAVEEMRKYSRGYLVKQAAALLEGVHPAEWRTWGKPGIRAQLVDLRSRTLIMDFAVEGDAGSTHVLNAVSPAFTCAVPFARHVVDGIATAAGETPAASADQPTPAAPATR